MQDQVKNIAGLRVLPLDSAEEPGKGGKKPDPILLLKQLRQRGYCLEVDLPTCVHPSLTQPLTSLSDKTTIFVSSSEEWDHLLSTWPGTLEGILSAILESLFQIYRRSKVFVERQEALHGIWEVAYIAYSNSLSSVFSAECLQDILDLLSRTFRRGSSEPGLSSAGSMMAGALWNMISNSRAMMKSPSEMKWDSPPSSPGLRDERLVTNHLLRNGLIKSCCDLVKEASSLDEIKLSHEFRSGELLLITPTLGLFFHSLISNLRTSISCRRMDAWSPSERLVDKNGPRNSIQGIGRRDERVPFPV